MVIKGRNVFLEDLSLDGALLINAIEDAEVSKDKLIACGFENGKSVSICPYGKI